MSENEEPIVSDFTPFNPFMPTPSKQSQPSYRQLLWTLLFVGGVTATFFSIVHFWR
jgi:hypothetical protein